MIYKDDELVACCRPSIFQSMFGYRPPADQPQPPAGFYFECEMTPVQRDQLLLLLDGGAIPAPALAELSAAVHDSRRVEMPLYRTRLDWAELEREARRQGCSAADILWDRAKRTEPA